MRMYFAGVLSTILAALVVLGVYRLEIWKARMSETFGEKFLSLAKSYDADADEWEQKLVDGWAGWNCGQQADGLYRSMALTLIEHSRETARAIRAELPGEAGYDDGKYNFENHEQRQERWQKWYDSFHNK